MRNPSLIYLEFPRFSFFFSFLSPGNPKKERSQERKKARMGGCWEEGRREEGREGGKIEIKGEGREKGNPIINVKLFLKRKYVYESVSRCTRQ